LTHVGVSYDLSLISLLTCLPCFDGHGDDFFSPDATVIEGQFGQSYRDLLVLDDALLRLFVRTYEHRLVCVQLLFFLASSIKELDAWNLWFRLILC